MILTGTFLIKINTMYLKQLPMEKYFKGYGLTLINRCIPCLLTINFKKGSEAQSFLFREEEMDVQIS